MMINMMIIMIAVMSINFSIALSLYWIASTTFTIVQNYDGISHFDLYRIEDASELVEVGLSHAMANDITLIEWPEIAKEMLPADTIHVFITAYNDGRKIQVT